MNFRNELESILGPSDILAFARETLRFQPDEHQARLLTTQARRVILNCTRQWGKSTAAAVKAVHHALTEPEAMVVIASPSQRQAAEFFLKCKKSLAKAQVNHKKDGINPHSAVLENGSRLVALPNSDNTIRGISGVTFLICDEAARIPDELYQALMPMLATTAGHVWLLSTPDGPRGFFYREWMSPEPAERISVKATECPRISQTFLDNERLHRGEYQFRQEYLCEFQAGAQTVFARERLEALVTDTFPAFPKYAWRVPKMPESANPWDSGRDAGPWTHTGTWYNAGLDLGQSRDPAALVLLAGHRYVGEKRDPYSLERPEVTVYTVADCKRFPLGTPYTRIVSEIAMLADHVAFDGNLRLAFDATGLGRPVRDMILEERIKGRMIPLTIAAGSAKSNAETVGKVDLIAGIETALESGVLFLPASLPNREALITEVCALERHFTEAGNVTIAAPGHDDLALALALAIWVARLQPRRPGKPDRFVTHEDLDEHQRAILKKGLGGPVGEQGYPLPWF